jgi:hypothetical protein
MTHPARNAETTRDVDLQRTRQAFLFAREQLSANRYVTRYVPTGDALPAGDARHRTPERVGGEQRPQDAPDWSMH